ncbi:inhibitor of KinA sporulation pathway (predicted exonuclease) [Bacillus mesophilus]|uniref:Exonuclease domain-containing protein n=1 Tax=Bacillus mesophilus TaxID=1808955 RepID=A0A6M0Q8M2_9BACI|nr:3'-5' exonuclease [Bacillus mesophilus]MBM7661936.1 inhibitor of KinA sporulation pathway (predicted exonuclease) [Bacillus mesophilus]NEY72705.1 exonuclease domain-containing protein [Bacillus mesophilus]
MAELKQFVFFDFEMLCSDKGMPFEEMEAIRLGAVKYDLETEKIEFFDRYIKPINTLPLSPFCKRLTGIKDTDLENAECFTEVIHAFLAWVNGIKKSRFFSWSTNDLTRLKHDLTKNQLPPSIYKKMAERYVDFQAVFTKRVSKSPYSVENALRLFDLQFIGDPHNPMYDAYNTFRIYQAFSIDKQQADLVMLSQFILDSENIPADPKGINSLLKKMVKNDINSLILEYKEFTNLKEGSKYIKRVKNIVNKYENIVINRSGLFSLDIRHDINLIIKWYQQLLISYEEHFNYSSRIIIWDEHTMKDFKRITAI